MNLRHYIRNIQDFPRPGVLFRDITPLLKNPKAYGHVIETFTNRYAKESIDLILGIEARGFIFAAALAFRLHKPFVPIRKKGKLPSETLSARYSLEYGQGMLEVHNDALEPGQQALIIDDLMATGGTMAATTRLVESAGCHVTGLAVVVELLEMGGRDRLQGYEIYSMVQC